MNYLLTLSAVALSLTMLSACDTLFDKKHADHELQIIYSPTGDPLNGGPLGRPSCADAMKHWFERLDTKHNGTITQDEFLADAKTQFQRMDLDKNGYLVSEEVERFRMAYRDEPIGGKHDKEHNSGNNSSVIDPVLSADTNLDFKVTLEEFISYSQKTYRNLDTEHNGKLSLPEVTAGECGDQNHEKH